MRRRVHPMRANFLSHDFRNRAKAERLLCFNTPDKRREYGAPPMNKLAHILDDLSEAERESLIAMLTAPRPLRIEGSALRFHVHSQTEDARIRKFKEPWTIDWLRRLPADSVLYDVGANIGITALVAAESAGIASRVVAIEPFPANFASLVRNIQSNNLSEQVIPLALGLGAQTKIIPLNWVSEEAGGALHSFGKIVYLSPSKRQSVVATHHCICMSLDDLVQMPGIPFPTHIKIDVDGGELDVLIGAAQSLRDPRVHGLQVETVDPDESRTQSRSTIAKLAAEGFSVENEFAHGDHYPRVFDIQFRR